MSKSRNYDKNTRTLSRKEQKERRKLEERAEREFQQGMRNSGKSAAPRGPLGDKARSGK